MNLKELKTRKISDLIALGKELKLEERDEAVVSKQLDPIAKKIDLLLDQNEKIAKAIVAIADMIKEKEPEETEKKQMYMPQEEYKPEPMFGQPSMPPPRPPMFPPPPPGGAPEPMPPLGMSGPMPDLEPLPGLDERPKKKGFGLFGKKK